MKQLVTIFTLCICTFPIVLKSQHPGYQSIEYSGDVLMFALPAIAGGVASLESSAVGIEQFVFSVGSTAVSSYFLKRIVNDPRPNGDRYGFPSRHTSIAFASAGFIEQRYGWKYGIPAYMLAAYVGWTRLYSGNHDWQDVAGGALLGVFLSRYFTRSYEGMEFKWSFGVNKAEQVLRFTWIF